MVGHGSLRDVQTSHDCRTQSGKAIETKAQKLSLAPIGSLGNLVLLRRVEVDNRTQNRLAFANGGRITGL